MPTSPPTVIIFGPTGNIARITALTASSLFPKGTPIHLGMRDPNKPIPDIPHPHPSYPRHHADLTSPPTLTAAVKASSATRAFIYLAFGTPDAMKSSLQALKDSGITFIVFLSSYTIAASTTSGNAADVPPHELIAHAHAQVELNLDEIFGPANYIAVRPGGFATNLLRHKSGIMAGEVRLYGGEFKMDCVTPVDMGRVCGEILINGPKANQSKVYVFGPQVLRTDEALVRIGRVLGRDVKITSVDETEGREQMVKLGMPGVFVEYMITHMTGEIDEDKARPRYAEGVENVRLYTGEGAMGLEE